MTHFLKMENIILAIHEIFRMGQDLKQEKCHTSVNSNVRNRQIELESAPSMHISRELMSSVTLCNWFHVSRLSLVIPLNRLISKETAKKYDFITFSGRALTSCLTVTDCSTCHTAKNTFIYSTENATPKKTAAISMRIHYFYYYYYYYYYYYCY